MFQVLFKICNRAIAASKVLHKVLQFHNNHKKSFKNLPVKLKVH